MSHLNVIQADERPDMPTGVCCSHGPDARLPGNKAPASPQLRRRSIKPYASGNVPTHISPLAQRAMPSGRRSPVASHAGARLALCLTCSNAPLLCLIRAAGSGGLDSEADTWDTSPTSCTASPASMDHQVRSTAAGSRAHVARRRPLLRNARVRLHSADYRSPCVLSREER